MAKVGSSNRRPVTWKQKRDYCGMEGDKQGMDSECEGKAGRETVKNKPYRNVNESITLYGSFKF